MIDADIKKFVLRRLLQKAGEPVSAGEIKLAIRSAFAAAFTEGDLDTIIQGLEDANYLVGCRDDLTDETLWRLTAKGTIQAQQLIKK